MGVFLFVFICWKFENKQVEVAEKKPNQDKRVLNLKQLTQLDTHLFQRCPRHQKKWHWPHTPTKAQKRNNKNKQTKPKQWKEINKEDVSPKKIINVFNLTAGQQYVNIRFRKNLFIPAQTFTILYEQTNNDPQLNISN